MKLPDRYKELRDSLPTEEVSYGCGGIKLLGAAELGDGQVGYSVAPDGGSLCGGGAGSWQRNWLVIGYETGCGDPLFIDVDAPATPVFTAVHGEGAWEPVQIATSIDAFANCLQEFSRISIGRSNPVETEANPVSDHERNLFLARIAALNRTSSAPEFWNVLLEF